MLIDPVSIARRLSEIGESVADRKSRTEDERLARGLVEKTRRTMVCANVRCEIPAKMKSEREIISGPVSTLAWRAIAD